MIPEQLPVQSDPLALQEYNPVVPISLGSVQFCGPLTTLHVVNDVLSQIMHVDELILQSYYEENGVDILYAQYCLEELYLSARPQLLPLCSPVQLQYIDTLLYIIAKQEGYPSSNSKQKNTITGY